MILPLILLLSTFVSGNFGKSGKERPRWPAKDAPIGSMTRDGDITWVKISKDEIAPVCETIEAIGSMTSCAINANYIPSGPAVCDKQGWCITPEPPKLPIPKGLR